MKVVIFCGGLGMRLREYGENIPKPLVPVGHRPIVLHLMRYYAHFGYKDFILCLGYRAEAVKEYFLNYNDRTAVMRAPSGEVDVCDISDWTITFADTGLTANIGQRLAGIREHVAGESLFMASYADGLTDLYLPNLIDFSLSKHKMATFMSVRPNLSYHLVSANEDGIVRDICEMSCSELRINGGFFVFRQDIFNYLRDGQELLKEPFQQLIREQQLVAYPYDGFFGSMDTFKDKQILDDLCASGLAPWQVWTTRSSTVIPECQSRQQLPIPSRAGG